VRKGVPDHLRSDKGPEFAAKRVRKWLDRVGVTTLSQLSHEHWYKNWGAVRSLAWNSWIFMGWSGRAKSEGAERRGWWSKRRSYRRYPLARKWLTTGTNESGISRAMIRAPMLRHRDSSRPGFPAIADVAVGERAIRSAFDLEEALGIAMHGAFPP